MNQWRFYQQLKSHFISTHNEKVLNTYRRGANHLKLLHFTTIKPVIEVSPLCRSFGNSTSLGQKRNQLSLFMHRRCGYKRVTKDNIFKYNRDIRNNIIFICKNKNKNKQTKVSSRRWSSHHRIRQCGFRQWIHWAQFAVRSTRQVQIGYQPHPLQNCTYIHYALFFHQYKLIHFESINFTHNINSNGYLVPAWCRTRYHIAKICSEMWEPQALTSKFNVSSQNHNDLKKQSDSQIT